MWEYKKRTIKGEKYGFTRCACNLGFGLCPCINDLWVWANVDVVLSEPPSGGFLTIVDLFYLFEFKGIVSFKGGWDNTNYL